ncbi:hypothetical protein MesoLjLc_59460 [Mesorhizobium sp. L-8-10]|nr:hypothetical protein MesoLjLb_58110 [Mesorhizobium sp. L-8-3]BCH34016.1 hypothetical protein MesoLjLc_59460 [Mesorhizobium sp. L-8-10]
MLLRFNREEREVMGAILPFVPRTAATKTTRPQRAVAASIIIFPGVRYERVPVGNGGKRVAASVSKGEKPKPARY